MGKVCIDILTIEKFISLTTKLLLSVVGNYIGYGHMKHRVFNTNI